MLAYVGRSNDELAGLKKALKATVRAEVDGTGRTYEGKCVDGWGYALVADGRIVHYRTGMSILDDNHEFPEMNGIIYAVVHARKASNREMVGSRFSHPFTVSTDKSTIFMCHNGLIRVDKKFPNVIDTEQGLRVIERRGVEKGIEMLKGITETGLNLFILQVDRDTGKTSIRYLNFYTDSSSSSYFDLFFSKLKDGVAVVSSSLLDHGLDGKRVEYGKLLDMANLQ
ncbi:MAG: hypothetical protein M1569_02775 [Candidatus Marsarchaeota archaeon]|nr:hypothetical protein [Candidatus Marsarchaeota archaeon]